MFRIDSSGATAENTFTEGNPELGTPATVVSAAWMNAVQEEIAGVVEGGGITLSKANDKQMLAAIKAIMKAEMASTFMPIGTIYGNDTDSRNPALIFGFGTWVAITGRFIVGVSASDAEYNVPGEQGGSKTHSHTAENAGDHAHTVSNDGWPRLAGPLPSPSTSSRLVVGSGAVESGETLESLAHASNVQETSSAGAHTHTVNSSSNLPPYRAAYLWRRTA